MSTANAAGQKPGTKVDNNWYCSVKFYDRVPDQNGFGPSDVIRSDGKGIYTHGTTERITCEIYPPGSGALEGNLHFQPQYKSPRRIVIVGQPGYAGAETVQPDFFEVWRLRSAATVGTTYLRAFRVTKNGAADAFRGDSFAVGTLWDGSSPVFVTRVHACAWDIEFDPDAGPVDVGPNGKIGGTAARELVSLPRSLTLLTGIPRKTAKVGDFLMPFKACGSRKFDSANAAAKQPGSEGEFDEGWVRVDEIPNRQAACGPSFEAPATADVALRRVLLSSVQGYPPAGRRRLLHAARRS